MTVIAITIINEIIALPVLAKSGNMPVPTMLRLMATLSLNAAAIIAVSAPLVVLGPSFGLTGWPLVGATVSLGGLIYILAARKFTPDGYMAYEDAFASALRVLSPVRVAQTRNQTEP